MSEIITSYNYHEDSQVNDKNYGYHGKILRINLSTSDIWIDYLKDEIYRYLIGGRNLIAYYLLRETPKNLDALSPENLLIFAPGILTGSPLPGSGRHAVGAKSPLTGAIASSEAGGWWGAELKRCGLDGLVISGTAKCPIYISIIEGKAEIRSANHLWRETPEFVQNSIRDELGEQKIRVAQIGLAGENQVYFASIIHDLSRAAGRAGLGAVMGSKNLKAIAIKGDYHLKIADKEKLQVVRKWFLENYKKLVGWRIKIGTPMTVMALNEMGSLPTENFKEGVFDQALAVSGETMHETVLKGRHTCFNCPIRCKQVVEIDDDDFQVNSIYGGPEYETLASFGPNCCISNLKAICKANELCNIYGLDTISTGGTISFVMECFSRGLLTKNDTGGESFTFGDADALIRAIEMIAHRKGFGDLMARGSAKLAEKIGDNAKESLVTVKNLEAAYHDPRLKFGLGLGYAVAPMGADHMTNVHDTNFLDNGAGLVRLRSLEDWIQPEPVPLNSLGPKKIEMFTFELNWQHFMDSAVTCMFFPYQYTHMSEALTAITGWRYDPYEIINIGKRANTLCRIFNIREGFSSHDDRLPNRLMTPYTKGPLKGVAPTSDEMEKALSYYYQFMGWDSETGIPKRDTLNDLNLSWANDFIDQD